jgi:hypothetical protein
VDDAKQVTQLFEAGDDWREVMPVAEARALVGSVIGALGADHVRIALVQPRDRLELALDRLGRAASVNPD